MKFMHKKELVTVKECGVWFTKENKGRPLFEVSVNGKQIGYFKTRSKATDEAIKQIDEIC